MANKTGILEVTHVYGTHRDAAYLIYRGEVLHDFGIFDMNDTPKYETFARNFGFTKLRYDSARALYPRAAPKGTVSLLRSNPLTRVKVASDSQRPRASKSAKGRATTTKAPSRRLMARRRATEAAPKGFYGNPLSRVKINSPSMATGEPPSKRLKARRTKTARQPKPGIYANPRRAKGPFYYVVESVPKGYFDLQYLSTHYTKEQVIELAQKKADKYDVQAKIREFHP